MKNKTKSVVIQGVKGSFHDQVYHEYYKEKGQLICASSFKELTDNVSKSCEGIMAIENSIAGIISGNHSLINDAELWIRDEYYLSIQQNLMALPEQELNDITEIYSHPMALNQCNIYLSEHPHLKLYSDNDTAESALNIKKNMLYGRAAIGSSHAAELYGLKIIAPSIQDSAENLTRFLIVTTKPEWLDNSAQLNITDHLHDLTSTRKSKLKSTISMVLHLKELTQITPFLRDLNLDIISTNVVECTEGYRHFVDLEFSELANLQEGLRLINTSVHSLKLLGVYQKREHVSTT